MPARVRQTTPADKLRLLSAGERDSVKQVLRDYPMVSPAAALRMLRDAGVVPSRMVTTWATVTTGAATATWTTWPATAARTAWATTRTKAGATWATTRPEARTTWPKAGTTTWAEAGAYTGTRTPSAPTARSAPAEAAAPSVAAPVPAGSAPAVEIKAITPAAEEELRLFKRRCLTCGNAELAYRHRLRRCRNERAANEPDTEGDNRSSQSFHYTILLFCCSPIVGTASWCSPFNFTNPRRGFAFQGTGVGSAVLQRA
jgi:hypothetical protein